MPSVWLLVVPRVVPLLNTFPVTVLTTTSSKCVANQAYYGDMTGREANVLPSLEATEIIVNQVIKDFKKQGCAKMNGAPP
jgi:hypothetical protein